jgi:hypothetical protein
MVQTEVYVPIDTSSGRPKWDTELNCPSGQRDEQGCTFPRYLSEVMLLENMSIRIWSPEVFLFCCINPGHTVATVRSGWRLEIELKKQNYRQCNTKDASGLAIDR